MQFAPTNWNLSGSVDAKLHDVAFDFIDRHRNPPPMTMDSPFFLAKTSIFAALRDEIGFENREQMPLASVAVWRVDTSSDPFGM